jgi:hypothetical protein
MMLGLSHNRVIVLDRRIAIVTLLSIGFANSILKPVTDGSRCGRRVTGLPCVPTAPVSSDLPSRDCHGGGSDHNV